MKKLIQGIVDFRNNVLPERREVFARLAGGQTPDALFITCSDSRVAPNWFASTDPGDLFVVRNVGNLVPPCDHLAGSEKDHSVAAAIDFSLSNLNISNILLCGHSGCGAIHALATGVEKVGSSSLRRWLRHGTASLQYKITMLDFDAELSSEDRLSQCNVLQQIEHLKTYPLVQERLRRGNLQLHAWWFEISRGNVYAFSERTKKFELITENTTAL